MTESDSSSKPQGSWDLGSITSAGKAWEEKVGATGKSLQEQLSSAGAAAEAALESGVDAVSTTVRSGLAAAKSETAAARSRLQQVYDTGAAHLEATEEQALGLLRQGVQYVRVEHPDASLAGAAALAALLLPGPRRFLLRNTLGRLRSEEAVFRSAEMRYGSLKERVEAQQGELLKLQERLAAAEAEYSRGLAKLKSSARELESLGSRVHSSGKAAHGLVKELRQLPSKAALQLRSDAANVAASASSQSRAVERSLKRVAKQYGL